MELSRNFDLRLSGTLAAVSVEVDSPAGQYTAPTALPCNVSPQALEDLRDAVPGVDQKAVGSTLWRCAFGDPVVRGLWEKSKLDPGSDGVLRLRLIIDAAALAALPWELLYDETLGCFLALDAQTPVTRFTRLPIRSAPWPQGRPLRLLFTGASPDKKYSKVHIDPQVIVREWQGIEREVAPLVKARQLETKGVLEGATMDALVAELPQKADIWHFVGHGQESGLLFVEAQGRPKIATAETLGQLFTGEGVRLVVLNTCLAGAGGGQANSVAGALLRAGIPAVVAMQTEVSAVGTDIFARAFYAAVAVGNGVDRAVTAARKAMWAAGESEWWTPALFMRTPEGRIWQEPQWKAETTIVVMERNSARKEELEERIRRIFLEIREYESNLDSEVFPVRNDTSQAMIAAYARVLDYLLHVYFRVCKRQSVSPATDILQLARALLVVDTYEETQEVRDRIPGKPDFYTNLIGARIIRIEISQVFRLDDLLTRPDTVRAKELYDAFTDIDRLRRMFNRRIGYDLGPLGVLRPTISSAEKYDRFWAPAVPNPTSALNQSICFVPLQLSLSERLRRLRQVPGSVLESTLHPSLSNIINSQISGRLRIYPPGTGIIHMGIALEFKEHVHVELVAQIAREIEALLFVDAEGLERPCEAIFAEIIDQVSDRLFSRDQSTFAERRWRPPETTFCIRGDDGFEPGGLAEELAYLMTLAPGNREHFRFVKKRVQKAANSTHWRRDNVFFASGQGVALLCVAASSASGIQLRRHEWLEWLLETRELVNAATYARQAFYEELHQLYAERRLDDSWLPSAGWKFLYLANLLVSMLHVMRAVAHISNHLKRLGTGCLITFAKDLWKYGFTGQDNLVTESLAYVQSWLEYAQKRTSDPRVPELASVLYDIQEIPPPFPYETSGYLREPSSSAQEILEAKLLTEMNALEEILTQSGNRIEEELEARLRNASDIRRQLGL